MKCSKCGNEIQEGSVFCAVCGTPVANASLNNQVNNEVSNSPNMQNNVPNDSQNFNMVNNVPNSQPVVNNGIPAGQPMVNNYYQPPKSNKALIIILIAVLVIGIGVGIYFLTRPSSGKGPDNNPTPTPVSGVNNNPTATPEVNVPTPTPGTVIDNNPTATPVVNNPTATPYVNNTGSSLTCSGQIEEEGMSMTAEIVAHFDASDKVKSVDVTYDFNDPTNVETYCSLFKIYEDQSKNALVICSGTKITITNYNEIEEDTDDVIGLSRAEYINSMQENDFTCR